MLQRNIDSTVKVRNSLSCLFILEITITMCPTVMELSSSDKIHATELCGTVKICDSMKVSDVDPSRWRYLKDM